MTQRSSNRRNRWVQGLRAVGLVAGLVASCGSGDDAAIAQGAPTDLSGVTQNWDKALHVGRRFALLAAFAEAAVLDKETGLVWELSPAITTHGWNDARFQCTRRTTGGRKGWRLPSVHELATLVDPNISDGIPPALPFGHFFTNVQSDIYWSATTVAELTRVDDAPTVAWFVNFNNGGVGFDLKADRFHFVWCVRGGMNASEY